MFVLTTPNIRKIIKSESGRIFKVILKENKIRIS